MASSAVVCIVTSKDFLRLMNEHKDWVVKKYSPPTQHIAFMSEILFLKDGSVFIRLLETNTFYGYTALNPEEIIDEQYINSIRPVPFQHIVFK